MSDGFCTVAGLVLLLPEFCKPCSHVCPSPHQIWTPIHYCTLSPKIPKRGVHFFSYHGANHTVQDVPQHLVAAGSVAAASFINYWALDSKNWEPLFAQHIQARQPMFIAMITLNRCLSYDYLVLLCRYGYFLLDSVELRLGFKRWILLSQMTQFLLFIGQVRFLVQLGRAP